MLVSDMLTLDSTNEVYFGFYDLYVVASKIFLQVWCGNGKAYSTSLYPSGVMPSLSCTPQIMAFDIHDGVPAATPFIISYSSATMFHGHFSCTID
jgi:hypothetical protein